MSSEDKLPEELVELERSLAELAPAPSRVDRDRLMFAAGAACGEEPFAHRIPQPASRGTRMLRTHGEYRVSAWTVATAASVLLACGFAALYAIERNRQPVTIRELVYVDRPTLPPDPAIALEEDSRDTSVVSDNSNRVSQGSVLEPRSFRFAAFSSQIPNYITFRKMAIRHGVDALPRREYSGPVDPQGAPPTAGELLKGFLPALSAGSTDTRDGWLPEFIDDSKGETI